MRHAARTRELLHQKETRLAKLNSNTSKHSTIRRLLTETAVSNASAATTEEDGGGDVVFDAAQSTLGDTESLSVLSASTFTATTSHPHRNGRKRQHSLASLLGGVGAGSVTEGRHSVKRRIEFPIDRE